MVECGRGDRLTIQTIARITSALGARISVRILWHGEGLDRLHDERHAAIIERTIRLLDSEGWTVATEVSFNVYGERGVIDVLAFHPATGALLVIEVKSVVPDLGGMLGTLDRKTRLAADLARERGWAVRSVSSLLVFPDDRTARRRVASHEATFRTAFPSRTAAVKRWLRAPVGRLAGLLFLSNDNDTSTSRGSAGDHGTLRARPRSTRARSGTVPRRIAD